MPAQLRLNTKGRQEPFRHLRRLDALGPPVALRVEAGVLEESEVAADLLERFSYFLPVC